MADPFDKEDRIAAATIVSALLTSDPPMVQLKTFNTLSEIAEMCYECASALASERQKRGSK
jgi:hypothetical protein